MEIEKLMTNPITLQIVQNGKITQEWTMERKIFNNLILMRIIETASDHYNYFYKVMNSKCHYDKKRKKWILVKNCRKHKR